MSPGSHRSSGTKHPCMDIEARKRARRTLISALAAKYSVNYALNKADAEGIVSLF